MLLLFDSMTLNLQISVFPFATLVMNSMERMSLPVVAHLQSLSGESLSRHHALIAAIFTAVLVCVFSILYDFFLVFLAKPEHFLPPKGVFDRFITPKLNVPLIEVGEDGDYRKALAQGSKLVSIFGWPS